MRLGHIPQYSLVYGRVHVPGQVEPLVSLSQRLDHTSQYSLVYARIDVQGRLDLLSLSLVILSLSLASQADFAAATGVPRSGCRGWALSCYRGILIRV
jgi:hypothetical protein